jgi:hypothetical protein
MRVRCGLRWNYADRTRIRHVYWACDIYAGAVAIVKHCFGNAVAVSIEKLPYVRQTIPLARILQVQDNGVVVYHVRQLRVVVGETIEKVYLSVSERRT